MEAYAEAAPGARPGLILFVQTFGDLANFNPHVHVLATDGAFLPDATFVPLPAVPEGLLAEEFRHAVLSYLVQEQALSQAFSSRTPSSRAAIVPGPAENTTGHAAHHAHGALAQTVKLRRNQPPRGDAGFEDFPLQGNFHQTLVRLTPRRASDIVAESEKGGLNFLGAASRAASLGR